MTVTAAPETRDVAAPERPADPRWARPGLLALLAGTALLYLWGLGSNGWANSYYAAAAQAGTQSWKAWLFGSLDAGNAITVDKPPAAMWLMGLSGRLFGFNEFTLLLPQALRQILPTWVNASTEIVKASTLLSVIGVAELLLSSQQVIARTFMTLQFYLFAGLLFFLINFAIERLGRYLEKRVTLP